MAQPGSGRGGVLETGGETRTRLVKPLAFQFEGKVSVKDLFGDELSTLQISNDSTIKAGETATWTGSRSVRFSMGDNKDRKLAELSEDKYKIVWEPQAIVFSDGTKLIGPET